MKLFIEVEISLEELPAAAELFKTLRTLTDHVKIRQPAAPSPAPVPAQPTQPPLPPPKAQPQATPPQQNNLAQIWPLLIRKLSDPNALDQVACDITRLLQAGVGQESDKGFKDFQQAFVNVIFDKELVMNSQSVVPYMYLIPRLPEPFKGRLQGDLIPRVLKHLTIKRPVDASRMDFFAQAEAFAAMVNMELVAIGGAMETIVTLLRKPDNRCAAVTMLGKTVELCLQQLTDRCEPGTLSKLRAALLEVNEDALRYDVDYIEESMGWTRAANGAPSDMGHFSGNGVVLRAAKAYVGHQSTIFALAYDSARDQLLSASRDGALLVWSPEGQLTDTLQVGSHYACGIDINQSKRTLFLCGVAKDGALPIPPLITTYEESGRSWRETGSAMRTNAKLVSCIKVVREASEQAFVTGESTQSAGLGQLETQSVCYYDVSRSASFATIKPVRQYSEHTGMVTCLAVFPPNPNIFLSGSRDCTVKVWDRRVDRSVGSLGAMGSNGVIQAHPAMVTSLDALDVTSVLSGGMEGKVHRWDFRQMSDKGSPSPPVSTVQLDDSAILKVAIRDASTAAVSTLKGLYAADYTADKAKASASQPFPDKRHVGRYHDLRWGKERTQLFAGGEDGRVDVYMVA